MSKTKKYRPTKNVGIAPEGATKAELVWLNLTPQTLRKILDLDSTAADVAFESWSTEFQEAVDGNREIDPSMDDLLFDDRIQYVLRQAKVLASKAGWRRTHPK